MNQAIRRLITRNEALFNAAKYGIAVAMGFLVTEVVLTTGVLVAYRDITVPSSDFSSPFLLELNALAFAIGVTFAFFLNDQFMMRNNGKLPRGAANTIVRLLKFQLVSLTGNLITIGAQLALLGMLSVSPSLGTIIGAVVAFPASYFFSQKFVWRISNMSRARVLQIPHEPWLQKRIDGINSSLNAIVFPRNQLHILCVVVVFRVMQAFVN